MRGHVISSSTGLLVLLGHPVAHSVSPAMHNAALAAAGLDLVYVALDVPPARVEQALAALPALGVVGANVTVPHKRVALQACDDLTERARVLGAVNTLVVRDGALLGDNTDAAGFLAGLPATTAAASSVVLGAGGASRAVVAALLQRGAGVTVLARDRARGQAMVASLDLPDAGEVAVLAVDDTATPGHVAAAEVVVNATPLGWHGQRLPAALHDLGDGQIAYDLNYPAQPSPFLADAATAGAVTVDGLAMLVGQAAESFVAWTGRDPDRAAMAAAARQARAHQGDPRDATREPT